jgi:hypothetical protein
MAERHIDMTIEADMYNLVKWLNEEQTGPIDRQALARLLVHVQYPPAQPEQEPVALLCCGYTDASAVKWNPFNGVVQCHNCGQTYTPPQRTKQEPASKYCCHSCLKASGGLMLDRMILCSECGNKRCPKASDHTLECTGSNELNQAGSVFSAPPAAQRKEHCVSTKPVKK